MKIKALCCLFLLSGALKLAAQTPDDSLTIVRAPWKVSTAGKGIVCKQAEFPMLYGVPQHVTIVEVNPAKYRLDVLIHSPQELTSVAAREAKAIAAINGSFFNMRQGNSVCYLRRDGVVIDTTANGGLYSVMNGAIHINKGKMKLTPWNKEREQACNAKRGTILVTGPMMLLDGAYCDLSACNTNFVETRHPRSAVCRTKDGKVLLVTVDGRFKGKAEGIRIAELAHLLRVLGGKDALNLDGGGSTTLWSASAADNGVLNKLCDNKIYDNQGERKVANSLCVYE